MMASRSQQHRKFVLYKLDFLEQQRSHVHDVVDTYVNKVVDKTKGWLDKTGGQQLTSQDLNQLIDSAVMFLVDTATQIQEGDGETVETETTETETQKTPSADVSLASDSGSGDTKELMARLETLEKTVSSLHNKGEELENLSAKQAEMEENLAQVKTDQSDQSESIEHILSQISSLENNQQIRMKKLKTRLGDLTKNLETVQKSQRAMVSDVEEKVDGLSEKMEEMKDKIVEDWDGQMKNLSAQVAEITEEMSDRDKRLGDEIRDVELRLFDVSNKVTDNDEDIQKMSAKITEIDATTEEMSEKLDKTQEKDEEKMKQLENKVLAVKRRRKKDFKDVETRYENVELQYKMVCSIVADRLLGLERLRDILNKKILARDQVAKATPQTAPVSAPKTASMGPQMFASNLQNPAAATTKPKSQGLVSSSAVRPIHSPSIVPTSSPSANHSLQSVTPCVQETTIPQKSASSSLIQDSSSGPIGFTAWTHGDLDGPEYGDAVMYYNIKTNDGCFLDKHKGRFTAPKDGKYRVKFDDNRDHDTVSLCCVRVGSKREICLCDQKKRSKAGADATYLVTLRCGDYLFLRANLLHEPQECEAENYRVIYFAVSYEG